MLRYSPWIFGLIVLVSALSWWQASRGVTGTPSHAACFTHRDCAKAEWCAVKPKGDGFATQGQCADLCTDEAQCLNGWRCLTLVESPDAVLLPQGPGERRRVCVDSKRF